VKDDIEEAISRSVVLEEKFESMRDKQKEEFEIMREKKKEETKELDKILTEVKNIVKIIRKDKVPSLMERLSMGPNKLTDKLTD